MPITPQEKVRIRYHLGYLNVQMAGSIQWGLPRPIQTLFIVEEAMNNVIEDAVGIVRNIVQVLDRVEAKLVESQDRLAAMKLGEITLRDANTPLEPDLLENEYKRWAFRLADTLGVPLYAYSRRFQTDYCNIPVRH